MSRITRARPSPSMVVAVIALIVAVGGVSYAAIKIPKKSVGAKQLKKNAVKKSKIKNAAVSTDKLADGAVNSAKVQDASLVAGDLAPGVLAVRAFGRVNDPPGVAPPTLANAVGLTDVAIVSVSNAGETKVTVDPAVLPPGGSVANCTVLATIAAPAPALGSLGFDGVINVAVSGAPLTANQIQVQTRLDDGSLADRDYYIQVTCPAV